MCIFSVHPQLAMYYSTTVVVTVCIVCECDYNYRNYAETIINIGRKRGYCFRNVVLTARNVVALTIPALLQWVTWCSHGNVTPNTPGYRGWFWKIKLHQCLVLPKKILWFHFHTHPAVRNYPIFGNLQQNYNSSQTIFPPVQCLLKWILYSEQAVVW